MTNNIDQKRNPWVAKYDTVVYIIASPPLWVIYLVKNSLVCNKATYFIIKWVDKQALCVVICQIIWKYKKIIKKQSKKTSRS
ncbi:hypothetical protein BAU15_12720 [Enterococcus sp. JM4C]|nr:hypothetical protein BAU15_12720 [Enterococcus sp. JM4C]